eukprot:s1565_g10.t1
MASSQGPTYKLEPGPIRSLALRSTQIYGTRCGSHGKLAGSYLQAGARSYSEPGPATNHNSLRGSSHRRAERAFSSSEHEKSLQSLSNYQNLLSQLVAIIVASLMDLLTDKSMSTHAVAVEMGKNSEFITY